MSHHTRIRTEFIDVNELTATLEELECVVQVTQGPSPCLTITALPSVLPETSPAEEPATGSATPEATPLVRFVQHGSTFELVADNQHVPHAVQVQLKDIVTRQHARRLTMKKLEAQGFVVTSEEDQDGTVSLLLSHNGQEVESHIEPDGSVSLKTRGFVGDECLAATKALEEALGGKVEERELTVEGFFGAIPLVPASKREYAHAVLIPRKKKEYLYMAEPLPSKPGDSGKK